MKNELKRGGANPQEDREDTRQMIKIPHRELVDGHIVKIDRKKQLIIDGNPEPYTTRTEKMFLSEGLRVARRKIKSGEWPTDGVK